MPLICTTTRSISTSMTTPIRFGSACATTRPLLQREVQLLRAEPLRGCLARASELSHLPFWARDDDRHHHERYRGPARSHPVRGSAPSRSAQAFAIKGFHATTDGGDRAADAPVLRARARPAGRFGPVRFHRGSRCPGADAHDRLSARHPRGGPGNDSGLDRPRHRPARKARSRPSRRTRSRTAISCSPSTSTGAPTIRRTT